MKPYLIVMLRIVTIMPILLFSTLFIMGKRPVGELSVFDLLSLVVLGAIVGADIAEPKVPHLPTVFAIIILSLLQRLISERILKSKKFKKLVNFEPTLIIQDGQLIHKNIKKIKFSIDEVLMLLREKGIFDIGKISYAIIEASGEISILKADEHEAVTKKDMNIFSEKAKLPLVVVAEKELNIKNMERLQISEQALIEKLKENGFNDYKSLFFVSLDGNGNISISPYDVEADVLEP